jgi:hypothetical protein
MLSRNPVVGDGTAIPKFMAPRLDMTFQINPSVDIFTPFTINNSVFARGPAKRCGNGAKSVEQVQIFCSAFETRV